MKVLHIDTSISGDESVTRQLTRAIVKQLTECRDFTEIVYYDLARAPLDHISIDHFGREAERQILEDFLSSSIVVLGAPMYNFSFPSQLKVWIDRILVPGETFRYNKHGKPEPILRSRKSVFIALACGGDGTEEASLINQQENYFRHLFKFIGLKDIKFVRAEGVAHDRTKAIGRALAQVYSLK